MLICPNATKIYVDTIVKNKVLNYTKHFLNVESCFLKAGNLVNTFKNARLRAENPANFRAFCEENYFLKEKYEIYFKKLAKNTCKIQYYIVK